MSLDFRNVNTLWASVLVETLARLGVQRAVISPGSRSAPLTFAFAQQTAIETLPILDERSAAFFALGLARQSGQPVVLVCTSGTAGANYFPAVIEAWESGVPLLILTADRPPELRDCAAGQAINQRNLFGDFTNGYTELAVPEPDPALLAYLRQTILQAWIKTQSPGPGPVHLNCPFREPLAPLVDPNLAPLIASGPGEAFFAHLNSLMAPATRPIQLLPLSIPDLNSRRGIIIAGPAQPIEAPAYCQAVATLAKVLGWPVLAEGLSPLRNWASLNPYLISTYDLILRNDTWAERLRPDLVLQLGPLPTSKVLRQWLTHTSPRRWVVTETARNQDPLHGPTLSLTGPLELLAEAISHKHDTARPPSPPSSTYAQTWCYLEQTTRHWLDTTLAEENSFFEGKATWLLSQVLPPHTPLFIANSMPVRDMEYFWKPGDRGLRPFFNRGANGIDGTLSTALGVAHRHQSAVLLTGDLALLHDTNGLLAARALVGHLTVVVINNQGGGIFEMLPISQFEPPFETYFATPQTVALRSLVMAYGWEYEYIQHWDDLVQRLQALPSSGLRVLEIRTDRKADARYRQHLFRRLSQQLTEVSVLDSV